MEFKIDSNESLRLDKYLIDKLNVSRNKLQEMISNNLVLVNGKKQKIVID